MTEGGKYSIKSDSEGNITVTLTADNGYKLESIKTSNGADLVVGNNKISAATTLKLTFTK